MRLATIRDEDAEIAAVVLEDGVVPMNALGVEWSDDLLALLESGRLREIQGWLDEREELTLPFDRVE